MNILIATGIYPPATSGPAQYAAALEAELKQRGHQVEIATFGFENKLPSGLRHLWFLLRNLSRVRRAAVVIALDTLSVGWPISLATRIFKRKFILRTGGDFLYEQFVERTGEPILLSQFYMARRRFTFKEKRILKITQKVLHRLDALIFSTTWQRDIWLKPYALEKMVAAGKIFIVENRFDAKLSDEPAPRKNFIFATRQLKYKNIERWQTAFALAAADRPEISLEMYHDLPHAELMAKIKTCYACVMPSLGEISPHFILDALRCNRPFLLTRESGYAEKLKNVGVLIDPLSINDMYEKILWLADENNYAQIKKAVIGYNDTHSWAQITDEILAIIEKV